jgi:hypothetical protein
MANEDDQGHVGRQPGPGLDTHQWVERCLKFHQRAACGQALITAAFRQDPSLCKMLTRTPSGIVASCRVWQVSIRPAWLFGGPRAPHRRTGSGCRWLDRPIDPSHFRLSANAIRWPASRWRSFPPRRPFWRLNAGPAAPTSHPPKQPPQCCQRRASRTGFWPSCSQWRTCLLTLASCLEVIPGATV